MKMFLECEIEVDDGKRFDAVELYLRLGGKWESVLLFAIRRSMRVREGKYMRVNQRRLKVKKVGEIPAVPDQTDRTKSRYPSKCPSCGKMILSSEDCVNHFACWDSGEA